MIEERFNYNPFTKEFFKCASSHSIDLHNKGRIKDFYSFVRGIIVGNTLYLRTYYPFNDLSDLNLTQLHQRSRALLDEYIKEIKSKVIKEYKLKINEVKFNVENDLLKGIGLTSI